jgi:hypothetical protein
MATRRGRLIRYHETYIILIGMKELQLILKTGNWYQDNRNEDPSATHIDTNGSYSDPHMNNNQYMNNDRYINNNTNNTPIINWGPWARLPNGQWHREGEDSSGIIKHTLFSYYANIITDYRKRKLVRRSSGSRP